MRGKEFVQKYLLARKDELGHYKKVETFSEPITPQEAQRYGPADMFSGNVCLVLKLSGRSQSKTSLDKIQLRCNFRN